MDWKYKHFKQEANFNAPVASVLEAARNILAGSFGEIEDTSAGFIARGRMALHPALATFRIASAVSGTRLTVELLVERFGAMGAYMLWDIGGYFNAQIDKWFTGISERLGGPGEQTLVNKTTSSNWTQRGCLAGCAVWLIGGASGGSDHPARPRHFSAILGIFPGAFQPCGVPHRAAGGHCCFPLFHASRWSHLEVHQSATAKNRGQGNRVKGRRVEPALQREILGVVLSARSAPSCLSGEAGGCQGAP